MKTVSATCCTWRRALIAGGVAAWSLALLADVAAYVQWSSTEMRLIAFYGIVVGVISMIVAAFVCGFDLQFQRESRAGNAELLDGGVILAAVLLFCLNLVLRLHSPESPLAMLLSAIGIIGVLAELYLDHDNSEQTVQRADRRTMKA